MRIISGKYKGKKLEGFNIDGTRPTMDRVKESLFDSIQEKISQSICLDLFAGSGSLGIEAISRGAKECDFVDNNIEALKILRKNTDAIEEKCNIINCDYKKYIKLTDKKYDIIFLDPPYNSKQLNKAIKYIIEADLLKEKGILVCEYETEIPICNLKEIKSKNYGSKKVKIFEK